jgi:hypothetical protein
MSEPGCGPGPVGVVGIIADLGLAVQGLENLSQIQI